MKNQLGSYYSHGHQHQNVLLHFLASRALAFLLLQRAGVLQQHQCGLQNLEEVHVQKSSGGRKINFAELMNRVKMMLLLQPAKLYSAGVCD